MTLDKETLTKAVEARDRLLDLQHSAEVARVDYHDSIRRLHAAGGSLREIAEALGLSHQRVHQIVEPVDGSAGPERDRGPGHRLHRRLRAFLPFERFTDEARATVASAIEEAAALGHRRVGTEHLLIGLAELPKESTTGSALAELAITRDALIAAVTARVGAGAPRGHGRRPLTPAARRVLMRASQLARAEEGGEIRGEHILLGIVADGGDGAEILAGLGATPERVRDALGPTGAA